MKMIRSIITGVTEGAVKLFSGSGRIGESFTKREYMQHYGFTSRPLQDGEALLIKDGNVVYVLGSDDRRYRIAIEAGEVALYTDEGDRVHIKRGGTIQVKAATKVILESPETEVTGNLTVGGGVSAGGDVSDQTGSMSTMRIQYNSHAGHYSPANTTPDVPME